MVGWNPLVRELAAAVCSAAEGVTAPALRVFTSFASFWTAVVTAVAAALRAVLGVSGKGLTNFVDAPDRDELARLELELRRLREEVNPGERRAAPRQPTAAAEWSASGAAGRVDSEESTREEAELRAELDLLRAELASLRVRALVHSLSDCLRGPRGLPMG
jgi:hypothetical protein